MNKHLSFVILLISIQVFSQRDNPFHTLNMPSASPQVIEMQKLGVTEVEIDYHSPALRNRDVWNNPRVIPQNGTPYPWRGGANMNTTISFSTDVFINDKPLKAGKYGFHVVPKGGKYTLLFAHNNNLWGSYYVDTQNDITLSVEVESTSCPKTEQLDYKFINRTNNSVVVALDWDTKRLPFTVKVDLKKTVVESLRSELRGVNTYRWEAWNDAANWCLQNDTNLEEALEWVDRSINGGINGYAANRNLTNLTTKARIFKKLNREDEMLKVLDQAMGMNAPAYDFNGFIVFLISEKKFDRALTASNNALNQHPNTWYLNLNKAVSLYQVGGKNRKKAHKFMEEALKDAPDSYKPRLTQILKEMKDGTYKIP